MRTTTILFLLTVLLGCQPKKTDEPVSQELVLPTDRQIEWAESEVGVLIHFDLIVQEPEYKWREDWEYNPDPEIFNPTQLDTDQWIKTAKVGGAKYAVLVAKHCTGFSLWPTEAHDYSVKSTPWREGTGDIVADFIASCRKYDVKPGIYASAAANGYFKVDNPGLVVNGDSIAQKKYNEVVMRQLTELWSNYGELFEIWFDGGVLPPAKGGPEIARLLQKLQPNAVVFQGPYGFKNLIRWVGNEEGLAPYPCWATADSTTQADGTVAVRDLHGNPNGKIWSPGEADAPLRRNDSFQGGWFWKADEDDKLNTLEEMIHKYDHSVGRNSNLLIGLVVDDRGLVPDADADLMARFGEAIKNRYGSSIAQNQGKGEIVELRFNEPTLVNHVIIMEEVSMGERIRKYQIEGYSEGKWKKLTEGESVGYKRIQRFPDMTIERLRLNISQSVLEPQIKKFAAYSI